MIMRVPMRVKTLNSDAPKEETVECMNISLRGTYFTTALPLKEGSDIEVRLKMPDEVVAGQTHDWTFTARVVHLERVGHLSKKAGVGVHFLYYSAE